MRPWTQKSALIQLRTSLRKCLKNGVSKGSRWLYVGRHGHGVAGGSKNTQNSSNVHFSMRQYNLIANVRVQKAEIASNFEGLVPRPLSMIIQYFLRGEDEAVFSNILSHPSYSVLQNKRPGTSLSGRDAGASCAAGVKTGL